MRKRSVVSGAGAPRDCHPDGTEGRSSRTVERARAVVVRRAVMGSDACILFNVCGTRCVDRGRGRRGNEREEEGSESASRCPCSYLIYHVRTRHDPTAVVARAIAIYSARISQPQSSTGSQPIPSSRPRCLASIHNLMYERRSCYPQRGSCEAQAADMR